MAVAARVAENFSTLPTLMAPRAAAALLRLGLNSWHTTRRRQALHDPSPRQLRSRSPSRGIGATSRPRERLRMPGREGNFNEERKRVRARACRVACMQTPNRARE